MQVAHKSLYIEKLFHDRRSSNRWPIVREIRYTVLGRRKVVRPAGSGKTLNISASGVLFTTESTLAKGEVVELRLSWPALLDGVLPIKLVAQGTVVRIDRQRAAISIVRYEFKMFGASGL